MARHERKTDYRTAVALRYKMQEDRAPKIIAKGNGVIAEKIIGLAQEYGVPIHFDPDLTQILAKIDLMAEIPPELYTAIAQVLAFVYQMNQKKKFSPSVPA
jgi:flagellar biosynthesis protein